MSALDKFANVKLSPDLKRLVKIYRKQMKETLEDMLTVGKITTHTTVKELIEMLSSEIS